MKIEKFLNWIQNQLLYYPEINVSTVKRFVDKLSNCLSEKELERNSLQINMIREITLKQISIDSYVFNEKIKLLDNQLNNLKESDKKR